MTFNTNEHGELISFKNQNGRELIHQANSIWNWYSPIIFPILGKAKNDQIICKGKRYSIKQHGIARHCKADTLINFNNHKLFEICSTPHTKTIYPYDFRLLIEYYLEKNTLHILYTVINSDTEEMYFNIGAHPGFNLEKNCNLKDYLLIFPEKEDSIVFSRDVSNLGIFDGNHLLLSDNIINDSSLFMTNLKSRYIILKNLKTESDIKINFNADTVGIWNRFDEQHPFICIEPWQTFANSKFEGELSKKPGIHQLYPKESYTFYYSIEIKN